MKKCILTGATKNQKTEFLHISHQRFLNTSKVIYLQSFEGCQSFIEALPEHSLKLKESLIFELKNPDLFERFKLKLIASN